jgi:hypothetical protein
MHVAASLLRESSKCGTRKSAWLLVALSLPMRAAQARSPCSTSIQQVADWLEKLGLRQAAMRTGKPSKKSMDRHGSTAAKGGT